MAAHCSSRSYLGSLFGASVRLQAGPYYPRLTAKETRAQQSYLFLGGGKAGGMILVQRKVQDPCMGSPYFTHLSLQAEVDPPKQTQGPKAPFNLA